MKKKAITIILIVAGLLMFTLPVLGSAKNDFPILDKLMKADFGAKKKVAEFIRNKYPNLRMEIFKYVSKNNPKTPALIKAEKMKLIADKYPGLTVKLPRAVLSDLEKKYPCPIMDIAVDITGLMKDKYPMLPAEVVRWRNESKIKSRTAGVIMRKHPTLIPDVMKVMAKGNYPKQVNSMKADIKAMMAKKHPGLKEKVKIEVLNLVVTKYPDLPEKIAAIKEDPNKNPKIAIIEMICKDHPEFIHEVVKTLRDKHGTEIYSAIMDALKLVEDKYPNLITDLPRDMSAMIAEKHPTLLTDIAKIRMDARYSVRAKVEKKYPDFRKNVKDMMAKKYPDLGEDIAGSIDKNFPGLKKDIADMMKTKFPGFMSDVKNYVSKKHPELMPKVEKMLK